MMQPLKRAAITFAAVIFAAALTSCGYHTAGQAVKLPSDLHTLAIPMFENHTTSYRIEQTLTGAVVREFNTRTNYHIENRDARDADATLRGAVTAIYISPLTYDSTTGRTSSALVTVYMRVTLTGHDGKVLFDNPNYNFRQQYEVSREVSSFFQEESPALERLSRDFARTLVSNILENY